MYLSVLCLFLPGYHHITTPHKCPKMKEFTSSSGDLGANNGVWFGSDQTGQRRPVHTGTYCLIFFELQSGHL